MKGSSSRGMARWPTDKTPSVLCSLQLWLGNFDTLQQGVAWKERLCSANIHAQKHSDGTFSYWKYSPDLLILHYGTEWLVILTTSAWRFSYFQDKFAPPKNTKRMFKAISYAASCRWKVWRSPQNIFGASQRNGLGDSRWGLVLTYV